VSGDTERSLAAARRRIAHARTRLSLLWEEAGDAMALGREDIARLALQRRQVTVQELEALEGQLAELREVAARVEARASVLDRLATASASEVPALSAAPPPRSEVRRDLDAGVERQLRLLRGRARLPRTNGEVD
jgi:phage shock protein A